MENAELPRFELNDLPLRMRTFSIRSSKTFQGACYFDWESAPKYAKFPGLRRLLNKCISDQAEKDEYGKPRAGGFLPPALLDHYLSREVVQKELEKEKCKFNIAKTLEIMFSAEEEEEVKEGARTYKIVFAVLALMERVCDVAGFVNEDDNGICDEDLPLQLYRGEDGSRELRRRGESLQRSCLEGWKDAEYESFDNYQWQLLVPTFALNDNNTIKHQIFPERVIFPWCEERAQKHAATSGGYAHVKKVRIHPLCHEFHKTLEAINVSGGIFAVKTLRQKDDEKFQKEVDALKRFNGLIHKHLVTLLGTFLHKSQLSMIFPSAECDVDIYWEKENPEPDLTDVDFVRWVIKQCQAIMEAVDVIHNPKYPAALPKETLRYGRHGDIKPENILWYKSPDEKDRGIWVISDLGLSAFNREESRSMIPNESILYTPGYRPPECDIEGGTISRAFDIWTLGCFYLETICWFLGGWALKERFQSDRTTTYIMGSGKDIFFDLELNPDDNTNQTFIALVKPEVVKTINRLHKHPSCTNFIHDFLDLIEQNMLIVLSRDKPQRGLSGELLKELNELHGKCMKDEKYCMERSPKPRPYRAPTGTEARLNNTAMKWVAKNNMEKKLPTHKPERPVHKSLPPEQLGMVDSLASPDR